MSEPGGPLDLPVGSYQRPNEPWVCGHAREGRPCEVGPSGSGRCIARAECRPVRNGERWTCSRSPRAGGPCDEGPLPDGSCARPIPRCQPVLGILPRRRRIVARVAVLTLAALGALYFGPLPFKEKLLMPGALSMYHRAAELQGADNCVKCHAAAQDAGAQNALCLKCHQDQLGDQPSNPHGFMPADLAAQRARLERIPSQRPFRLAVVNHLPKPHLANGQVACVTCHKEHEGTRGVDAKMDKVSCQVCHVTQFGGLAEGHPEFGEYPRRHLWRFSHETDEHRDVTQNCAACHSNDLLGQQMEVNLPRFTSELFQKSCATCHGVDLARLNDKSDTADKSVRSLRPTEKLHGFPHGEHDIDCKLCHGPGADQVIMGVFLPEQKSRAFEENCAACHDGSIAPFPFKSLAASGPPASSAFTASHFAHMPHQIQMKCDACHLKSVGGGASGGVPPDFQPIRKQKCLECHNAGQDTDNCQKCHDYHRNPYGFTVENPAAPVPAAYGAPPAAAPSAAPVESPSPSPSASESASPSPSASASASPSPTASAAASPTASAATSPTASASASAQPKTSPSPKAKPSGAAKTAPKTPAGASPSAADSPAASASPPVPSPPRTPRRPRRRGTPRRPRRRGTPRRPRLRRRRRRRPPRSPSRAWTPRRSAACGPGRGVDEDAPLGARAALLPFGVDRLSRGKSPDLLCHQPQ